MPLKPGVSCPSWGDSWRPSNEADGRGGHCTLTQSIEDLRTIVRVHVDAAELRHGLDGARGHRAVQIRPSPQQVEVASLHAALPLNLGQHRADLLVHCRHVCLPSSVQTDQGRARLIRSADLREPARRVGKVQHADEEEQCGHILQRKRDAPLSLALDELAAVACPVGDEEASADRLGCQLKIPTSKLYIQVGSTRLASLGHAVG